MVIYSGGPSLYSNTYQVVDAFWLALMVISYIILNMLLFYLEIAQSCAQVCTL